MILCGAKYSVLFVEQRISKVYWSVRRRARDIGELKVVVRREAGLLRSCHMVVMPWSVYFMNMHTSYHMTWLDIGVRKLRKGSENVSDVASHLSDITFVICHICGREELL